MQVTCNALLNEAQQSSSRAQRGRGTAEGGGGGALPPGSIASGEVASVRRVPSTALRAVPLHRCAGEESHGLSCA
jgi:hypothetical protein